jgi:hypothetical protein
MPFIHTGSKITQVWDASAGLAIIDKLASQEILPRLGRRFLRYQDPCLPKDDLHQVWLK